MCFFWPLNFRCSFFKCRIFVSKGRSKEKNLGHWHALPFFETRGSPDAPWVTSAEYPRVLRDSKRPVLNEWFMFFFVAFLCLCSMIWRWFSKDVRFFSDQRTSTCMYLRHDGFWKQLLFSRFLVDECMRLVPVLTASTRHLWFCLFYLTSHPAVQKVLSLKRQNHFFSRKHGHTTSPSFFRWADLLSAG